MYDVCYFDQAKKLVSARGRGWKNDCPSLTIRWRLSTEDCMISEVEVCYCILDTRINRWGKFNATLTGLHSKVMFWSSRTHLPSAVLIASSDHTQLCGSHPLDQPAWPIWLSKIALLLSEMYGCGKNERLCWYFLICSHRYRALQS